MAHETPTSTLNADYQALLAQLATLREDLAKLTQSAATTAEKRGHALAQDVSDGINEAARFVGRKGHDADLRLEGAVSANPYIALGIAAGLGLLLGALTRR